MYAKPFVCSNLANSGSGLARKVLEKAELGLPPDCLTYTKGWRGSPGRPRFGDDAAEGAGLWYRPESPWGRNWELG